MFDHFLLVITTLHIPCAVFWAPVALPWARSPGRAVHLPVAGPSLRHRQRQCLGGWRRQRLRPQRHERLDGSLCLGVKTWQIHEVKKELWENNGIWDSVFLSDVGSRSWFCETWNMVIWPRFTAVRPCKGYQGEQEQGQKMGELVDNHRKHVGCTS